jgi:large subunit ribosomal protein L9
MKVILNQDVKGIGKKLQTIEVSEGYARNYLLPKKLAILSDNKSVNETKNKIKSIEYQKDKDIEEANKKKAIIEKNYIEFKHKVGENSKLFGSITEKEIATKIDEVFKIKIDKKKILIKETIKMLGSYVADIKLYDGIIAKLKINVIKL